MPQVTELVRLSGDPSATTKSPGRMRLDDPMVAVGRPVAFSMRSTARSDLGSTQNKKNHGFRGSFLEIQRRSSKIC